MTKTYGDSLLFLFIHLKEILMSQSWFHMAPSFPIPSLGVQNPTYVQFKYSVICWAPTTYAKILCSACSRRQELIEVFYSI
jgi:hypothetical protein